MAIEGDFCNAERFTVPTDLQIGLSEQHTIRLNGKGMVVLDFGKELHGGVRILAQYAGDGEAAIRIRTGESVSECYAETGEKNAGNYHTLRDISTRLLHFSDQTFFETGFRFVRIDFTEDKEIVLKAIVATSVMRDLHPIGGFHCDDERVNRIFEVACRTLMLNMQTHIWDGIKRDRLVWIGDMHPEMLGILCLFGQDPSVEDSLSYCKEHTPVPLWMNNIPTYTAWWLIILHDYYFHNHNIDYLRAQSDYIADAIGMLEGLVKEDGQLDLPKESFFDWPSHETSDEREGIRSLLALTAEKAATLCGVLGLDPSAAHEMHRRLFLKRPQVKHFKQCEAFSVYAGFKTAEEAFPFLTEHGAHGFSAFMSYYLLSVIADVDPARALALMKEYFGGMLDMGATSFWEDFDLDWMENSSPIDRLPRAGERDIHGDFGKFCYIGFRHSLCHGWSCGPIIFLIKKLSGIKPLEPGCKKVSIHPVSAGLKKYDIKFPTPQGVIEVKLENGKFDVTVPEGIEVVG